MYEKNAGRQKRKKKGGSLQVQKILGGVSMSLVNMFLNMPTMVALFMFLCTSLTYFIFKVIVGCAVYDLLVLAYQKNYPSTQDAYKEC